MVIYSVVAAFLPLLYFQATALLVSHLRSRQSTVSCIALCTGPRIIVIEGLCELVLLFFAFWTYRLFLFNFHCEKGDVINHYVMAFFLLLFFEGVVDDFFFVY